MYSAMWWADANLMLYLKGRAMSVDNMAHRCYVVSYMI